MKLSIIAAAVALAVVCGPSYAACTYPKAPEKLPDGTVAAKEDMLAGKRLVEQYNKDMEAYLACIKLEYDAQVTKDAATLTPEQKAELDKRQTQKYNAAVDELQAVAERFNEQIRAYNKAHPK
ncbi:MAG: hypothetical protein CMLOHMNK_02570 [Steroidobacteraceae bacterium]|nr:hypothetical protein [Steroidobacteraceae bacterium]